MIARDATHKTRSLLAGLFLLLLLLATLLPGSATAQAPGISLVPQALYDGTVKYGEWLPVRVRLENSSADVTGRVQVAVTSAGQRRVIYAQEVELARGARKEVTLYVLPNTFTRRLVVEFISDQAGRDDEPLARMETEVQPVPNVRLVSATIAGGGTGLDALAGLRLPSRRNDSLLVPLTLETLPERPEGLRTLDVLAITGVDTQPLTAEQRAALIHWVEMGGTLVLGGGPTAARTLNGLPETLHPVSLTGETALEGLPGLEAVAGGELVRVVGPFPAAQAAPIAESQVRAEQDGLPLVVTRRLGQGTVVWLAVDPALTPFDAWAGAGPFWISLLSETAAYPFELPPDISPREMSAQNIAYALTNMPSLDLPSLRLLAPLLLVYIVVVGPLNYLLLRWRRRLELAWLTIPAITLLFSAGAYAVGYQLRGGDVIINQISTIQFHAPGAEGGQSVRSFVGIFSPARRQYNLEVPGEALVSPLNVANGMFGPESVAAGPQELLILQGRPATIRGLDVNQWSLQSFMVESIGETAAGLEATASIEGESLVGTVKNTSGETWEDVAILHGARVERLGTLAPGQEAQIGLELNGNARDEGAPPLSWLLFQDQLNNPGPSGPPRDIQVKQQVLDAIFSGAFGPSEANVPGTGPLLVAWADTPPLPVTLPQYRVSQVSTTLIYGRLPLSFGTGEISLPARMIRPRLESGALPCYGPAGPGLAPDFDEATITFALPSELRDLQVTELALHVTTDGGWFSPPAVNAWAWEQSAWVPAGEDLKIGRNEIVEPARFVRNGQIRLQAINETRDRGGCIYLDISLRGLKVES